MDREKLIEISEIIKAQKVLYFRLYNVLYKIAFSNNFFSISQSGINLIYKYPTLKEMFNDFIVYGSNLIESIDDIKIVERSIDYEL